MKIMYRKCPFVSKELKQLMSLRNKGREIARRPGLPEDWQRYRESWDDVEIKLREAERQYLQKETYNNKNLNKKLSIVLYLHQFSVRLEGSRSDCVAKRWGSRGAQ